MSLLHPAATGTHPAGRNQGKNTAGHTGSKKSWKFFRPLFYTSTTTQSKCSRQKQPKIPKS